MKTTLLTATAAFKVCVISSVSATTISCGTIDIQERRLSAFFFNDSQVCSIWQKICSWAWKLIASAKAPTTLCYLPNKLNPAYKPPRSHLSFLCYFIYFYEGKKKMFSLLFYSLTVFRFLLYNSLLSVPHIFPSFGRLNHKRDVIFRVRTDRWNESAFGWIIIQYMNTENIFHWSKIRMSVCQCRFLCLLCIV